MAEAAKPKVLDGPMKAFLVLLWLPTYEELGDEAFYRAFLLVLNRSTFFPDIAEIRKAAGLVTGIVDPVEGEARISLREIVSAIRAHGPRLAPLKPKLLRDRDDDGRALNRADWVWGPVSPSPTFDALTEAALLELGFGVRDAGLEVISRHPSLNAPRPGAESNEAGFRSKLQRDVEADWLRAYRDARTNKSAEQ